MQSSIRGARRMTRGRSHIRGLIAGTSFILLTAVSMASAQQQTITINVPAGALSSALNRFAVQAGVHIGFDSDLVRGLSTKGLSGTYPADEALGALLSGTDLHFSFTDARTVTLSAAAGGDISGSVAADGGTVLETIVVDGGSGGVINASGYVGKSSATGAKTDTPFTETPQSVSSVTEAQIKDRNPQTLLDAIAYTPGARVNAYGVDPRYDSFFVRGFNVTSTGVFRDNLRQPVGGYGFFATEPYGIEGISILRGPSSALYGASGAGGLYNVITKRPLEEAYNDLQLQLGTDNRYQAQFDFSGPVGDQDGFYYRLTGLGRQADTEFASVPDDRYYIAPAFTWKPDEDTKLTLLGEYARSNTGGNPAYYNDYYGHVSGYEAGDPAYGDHKHDQARFGWEFEHSFNDTFTFRQNARYSWQDVDAKYAYAYNGTQHTANPALIDRGNGRDIHELNTFVIDNQLETHVSTGPLEHTILTGVDFTWVDYLALSGSGTIAPLNTLSLNYGQPIPDVVLTGRTDQRQLQTGIYVQDQIRFDDWTLTAGGRYDWVSTRTDDTNLTSGAVTSTRQDDGQLTGRIGLTYETPWGFVPYASYSTAFSPNIGMNSATGTPFKPTTSKQQEVGVKYLVPGTNMMVTAALFNIDQENGIYYEASFSGTVPVQRGKLRSRGAEVEATVSLDNGVSLAASYTYTDTRVLVGPTGIVGNFVSSVPFQMASLWAHYALPEDTALYGLSGGLGARIQSASYGDDRNSITNSGRVTFDASLGYDFAAIDPKYKGLSLQVNATNVLDRRETTCTSGYCYPDPGRTVIGTLRYTW